MNIENHIKLQKYISEAIRRKILLIPENGIKTPQDVKIFNDIY